MNNQKLNRANKAKNDEFYTKLTDIEKELMHYKDMFVGKTIYCNCDDPVKSNFVQWFYMRFNILHLKRVIVTAYNSDTCNGWGYYWDSDFATVDPKSLDISKEIEKDVRKLNGNGDFRSEECIELLKQADIVVTNPPFSLFREYVKVLMDNNKEFLIIGNMNALKYKEVFPYIKNNKIGLGFTNGGKSFIIPNGEEKTVNICWYTTFPISKHNEELILFRKYTPEAYPKYDNYDAINVDKLCDIPEDYDGVIGVPISFLDKYNPKQFEILGQTSGRFEFGIGPTFKYEQALCHNIDGSIINGSKINTEPCFLNKEKPVNQIYYTASNRDGYIHPIYTRILIRKIK
jgi:hypothetical protein